MKDVVVVWFESAEPGTAAGQHLKGTLQRLDEAAVPVAHVVAQTAPSRPGWIARARRLVLMQAGAVRAGGRERLLLIRMHPAALVPVALHRLRGGSVVLMAQGNIADLHAAYPFTTRLPIDALFIKPTIAMSTSVVVPTAGILDWISHDLGLTTPCGFVVENGFDGDSVAAASPIPTDELAQMGLRHRGFVVFVGKFATWQGIDTILSALDSGHWPDDLPIVFVGDGAEEPLVVAAAARDSRVHYVGRVSAERALAWTASAAMSLAVRKAGPASDRGVSPYKVLEAAALGTPVVATRVRGQSSLVEDLESGVLIDPDDPPALADAVRRLWRDRDLRGRLSVSSRRRSEAYTWRAGARGLVAALRSSGWPGEAGQASGTVTRGERA